MNRVNRVNRVKIGQEKLITGIFIVVVVYLTIACLNFSLKHPWATQIQSMMCFKEILLFQTVDRNVIDPR